VATSAEIAALADLLAKIRTDRVRIVRELLDMEPHPGQERWLKRRQDPENFDDDGDAPAEAALVTGNRWGKSHVAAADIIVACATLDGWTPQMYAQQLRKRQPYQALNCSVTADQANLVWYKAYAMLQGDRASWLVDDVKFTPFPTIKFRSGAIFQARSTAGNGHHLLGHDYDYVNWDEAAYEPNFEQVRDNVLRMRLVDRGGKLNYTSTGNGRNAFGRYFLTGLSTAPKRDKQLYSQSGSTLENPNVDHKRLEQLAARMSEQKRRQNINGEIVDGGGDYFPAEDLQAALETGEGELDLNDLWRELAVDDEDMVAWAQLFPNPAAPDQPWRLRYPSHRYIHAWDLADKRDWTVGSTWDLTTPRATMVEFERFHKRGWDHVYARIRDRHRRYGGNTYLDLTGVGDVVGENLADIGAEGVNFAGKGKKDGLLENWRVLINLRQVRWPAIGPWVDEHSWYARDDEGLVKDCVMSGAIAGWFMRRSAAANAPASAYR
jgi:hypothetical protein